MYIIFILTCNLKNKQKKKMKRNEGNIKIKKKLKDLKKLK